MRIYYHEMRPSFLSV